MPAHASISYPRTPAFHSRYTCSINKTDLPLLQSHRPPRTPPEGETQPLRPQSPELDPPSHKHKRTLRIFPSHKHKLMKFLSIYFMMIFNFLNSCAD